MATYGTGSTKRFCVRLEKEYRIEAFDISITERKALCPAGKTSTNCSKLTEEKSGKVTYRFEFGSQCHSCPHKAACVPSTLAHRSILVEPITKSCSSDGAINRAKNFSFNAPTKCDRGNH